MSTTEVLKIYAIVVGKYALGVALSMTTQYLLQENVIDREVVEKKYLPSKRKSTKTPELNKLTDLMERK